MQRVERQHYEAAPGFLADREVPRTAVAEWLKPDPHAEDLGARAVEQNIRIVSIDVEPLCRDLLLKIFDQSQPNPMAWGPGKDLQAIRALHYLSVVVFTDYRYDPTLVIEANFDGPAGPFWAELDGVIGPSLRAMLKFCKRPGGNAGVIFDRVTAPGSEMPLAPLLEAISQAPRAWHAGNRGMSRARIEAEAAVFRDVRKIVDRPKAFSGASAQKIHEQLRNELLLRHPCLTRPAPPRFSLLDQLDWLWAVLFGFFVLAALALPAILLTLASVDLWPSVLRKILPPLISPPIVFPSALMVLTILLCVWSLRNRWARPIETPIERPNGPTRVLLIGVLALLGLAAVALLTGLTWWLLGPNQPRGWAALSLFAPVILGILAMGLVVVAALRSHEESDAWQNAPPADMWDEREIATREDRSAQNHMASLVHIKSGALRGILQILALKGLGLAIRLDSRARQGYLINVRTIHFAHLTLLNNNSRLLFLSNFDGTWDNYLTDFIEKVRAQLNLVWTAGAGFPPTRFYVLEGVMHGRLFKVWKRRAMAPTRVWFCAYPDISVEQVWRQARVADGLRRGSLNKKEAEAWAMDL